MKTSRINLKNQALKTQSTKKSYSKKIISKKFQVNNNTSKIITKKIPKFLTINKKTSKSVPKKIAKPQISSIKNNFRLSDVQKKMVNELENEFKLKSASELKALLRKNNQIMSGSKIDLIDRCVQGKLLGALPMCLECSGGKLKFNIKTGQYMCPGYMDDTDFRYCGFKANYGDVIRGPWTN